MISREAQTRVLDAANFADVQGILTLIRGRGRGALSRKPREDSRSRAGRGAYSVPMSKGTLILCHSLLKSDPSVGDVVAR